MTKRERAKRWRELADQARPCPRCGGYPEIDLGPIDAEFEPGMEFFHCPYYIGQKGRELPCDSHAQGLEAWNYQPAIDRLRNENPPCAPADPVRDALVEALNAMLQSVCGPTGFADAVRHNSGLAYPWLSLDRAETLARAALELAKGEKP